MGIGQRLNRKLEDLVGNSFGGTVAFGFALRHPARAAGVAVLESEPATAAWATKMAANLAKAKTELARTDALAWITVRYGRHTSRLAKAASRMLHSTTLATFSGRGAGSTPGNAISTRRGIPA